MDFENLTEKLIEKNQVAKASSALESEIDIQPLLEQSEGFEITNEVDAKNALSMSLQARKLKKALEEARTKIIRPHLDFQRSINEFAKSYTAKLNEIEEHLKGKLQTWLEVQKTFEPNFSDMMMEVEDGKLTKKMEWISALRNSI